MRIVELVFQGVVGSPGLLRVPVGAGATLLEPGPAGPLPLVRLLGYLLYDESMEPPAELRAPGASASRAAVTLQDAGGNTYRMLRDLERGAVQLGRWVAAQKQYETLSTQPAEAGQYLRAQARVPGEDLYQRLFSLAAAQLPSRQPRDTGASKSGLGRPHTPPGGLPAPHTPPGGTPRLPPTSFAGFESAGDPYGHLSAEEKRARLAELEQAQAALAQVDEVQFELDGLQSQAFEIDQKLRSVTQLEQEVSRLTEIVSTRFADLAEVPENLKDRLAAFEGQEDRLAKTLQRIEGERSTLGERAPLPPQSPVKNPLFLGGLVAAASATAAAIGLEMQLILLANPLALGAAGFALLGWVSDLERHARVTSRTKSLGEREEKARRQFEVETLYVRKLMEDLDAESPAAVLERIAQRDGAAKARDEARARLETALSTVGYEALSKQRAELDGRIQALEQQLAGTALGHDAGDLAREISGLQASLAAREAPPLAPAPPPVAPVSDEPAPPDPTPSLAAALAEAVQADSHAAFNALRPRLSQYLSAFTGRRFTDAELDGRQGLQVASAEGPRDWTALTDADRDRVYLALRLACAEAAIQREPQPLVVDCAFDALEPELKAWTVKMLQYLAGRTQVLMTSPDPVWTQTTQAVVRPE